MRRFAAIALLTSLALAGCSSAPPPDGDGAEPTAGTPLASPPSTTETEAADPELGAFRAALDGQVPADPDALVTAIEAAGFDRSAIERTRELDSLGAPVTFLEVAVHVADGCLVGQVGDGEPMALRTAALSGERCLVGDVIGLD